MCSKREAYIKKKTVGDNIEFKSRMNQYISQRRTGVSSLSYTCISVWFIWESCFETNVMMKLKAAINWKLMKNTFAKKGFVTLNCP